MSRLQWVTYRRLAKVEWTLKRLARQQQTLVALAFAVGVVVILIVSLVDSYSYSYERRVRHRNCVTPPVGNSVSRLMKDRWAVERGREEFLVPNYVHMYRAGAAARSLSVVDVMCLLAAYRHQRPDQLIIHTDDVQAVRDSFITNQYGRKLWALAGFRQVLRLAEYPTPQHVFGLPFSEQYRDQHIADIVRLRILRKYGGIFLENRVYLAKNMDELRKEELMVGLGADSTVDNSVIAAHRDSRLLSEWLTSYMSYNPSLPHQHTGPRVTGLFTASSRSKVLTQHALTLDTTATHFLSRTFSPLLHYAVKINSVDDVDYSQLDSDVIRRFLHF